ncbi:hypothetical protein BDR26DRAFT_853679 [Obelidium mucronatum]|nr:hypothetical protein BDR26DRAFT_853679 [Obelidium mucronatum]
MQPLSDFAILFNRNTFGLSPAEPLTAAPIFAGQSSMKAVGVKVDGAAAQVSNPVNNLQVAVKCSVGILYFQASIPLHILFLENSSVEADSWLRSWGTELPPSTESVTNFQVLARYGSVDDIKNKLFLNNIFTIAQRSIDPNHVFYTHVKLVNGVTILSEIKFDLQFAYCMVSSKSLSTHFIPAFEAAVTALLNA